MRRRDFTLSSRGFIMAPMLYALMLVGVGAGVLFSSYSQILRSGVTLTNTVATKNDLSATSTTLATISAPDLVDNIFCPPGGSGASSGCTSASGYTQGLAAFSMASANQLPSGCTTSGGCSGFNTGSAKEMGILLNSTGVKQMDAWGHNYIYCRWESSTATGTSPAYAIISAGANGILETHCGDTTSGGDDQMTYVTVATAASKASVWQQTGTGTSTAATFGLTGSQIKADANGTLEATNIKLNGLTGYMYANGSSLVTAAATIPWSALTPTTMPAAQMPALTGDVTSAGATLTTLVSAIKGTTVSGTTGSGSVVFSASPTVASPTVTGTLIGASALFSGTVSGPTLSGNHVGSISGTAVGGTTGTGNVVFSAAPTLTGTLTGASALFSGTVTGATLSGNHVGSISGTSVGGTTGTGNVVFSAAPTLTGQLNGASAVFSGNVSAASFTGLMNVSGTGSGISGIVGISNGGTGLSAVGTSGLPLISNGTGLAYGVLGVSGGGTGLSGVGLSGTCLQSTGSGLTYGACGGGGSGGLQGGVTLTATLGAGCSTAGLLATDANGDLLVCDNLPTTMTGTSCSALNAGALTFDINGTSYICLATPSATSPTWQPVSSISSAYSGGGTPNAFSFINQVNVGINTLATSNTVTLSGFSGGLTATCSGCGGISRNGGTFQASPVTGFYAGNTIAIQLTSSSSLNTAKTATVTVGPTTSATWSVTTASDPCSGIPALGTTCADGTVYVGLSPDGNNPMFTTPTEVFSGMMPFGVNNTTLTGITNPYTGRANTAAFKALSNPDIPYNAILACTGLNFGGHTDWYLPAVGELSTIWANVSQLSAAHFIADGHAAYWSSTASTNGNAQIRYGYFWQSGDFATVIWETNTQVTRCIRRAG